MARKDGRYKCSTKGCRNYVSHGVLCSTCASKSASVQTEQVPLETNNDESGLQPPAAQSAVLTDGVLVITRAAGSQVAESPEPTVTEVVEAAKDFELPYTAQEPATEPKKRIRRQIDTADVVRRYQAGEKIVDIAVAIGFPRGQGQNKTRAILREAGVFHERQPDAPGYVAGT